MLAFALAAGAAVLGGSCSEDAGSSQGPCATVYKGQCGTACSTDLDCSSGLYCSNAACTADCADGAACANGQVCSARGRCEGGDPGGTGGVFAGAGGTGGSSSTSTMCPDENITFGKQIPTVLLLIDQSSSMLDPFSTAGDRWDVLYTTLMNPDTGIVKTLENEVRFGLALYSSNNGTENGATCPLLTEVGLAVGNYDEIDAIYRNANPIDDTPTGDSIVAVTPDLVAYPEPGPKIIVLATDGEPDSCATPDPQTNAAKAASIAAAQDAFSQGIQTFVISVGDEVGADHLQDMANAGVGLQVGGATDAPFYVALNEQELINAFDTIINGARSCIITLKGTVAAGDESKGTVTLDGQQLVLGDPNGWTFTPPNQVELVGTACETIKDGDHQLSVTFPCGIVQPE